MKSLVKLSCRYLIIVTLQVSVLVAVIWWLTWPIRSWESFILALENNDALTANRYCDTNSFRVHISKNSSIHFEVRSSQNASYIDYPLDNLYGGDIEAFRMNNGPRPSNLLQIVTADIPLTSPKGIWFGQLRFQRGKICFFAQIPRGSIDDSTLKH